MTVLVDLPRVTKRAADRPLFTDLSVTVHDGDRLGIVGINGTGKSTLLSVLAGLEAPDAGEVRRGRGVRTEVLVQVPELGSGTVRDYVGAGWEPEAALDRLGMTPMLDAPLTTLSGGQAKRVALAKVLAAPSELLILDEPTNHLDLAGVSWLEEFLVNYPGGLVLVSHDRYLLDRLTTRMLELDRASGFLHEGSYADYLDAKAVREEHAQSAEATRKNLARSELAWLRRGAKARSRKPQARVDAAKALLAAGPQAQAREGDLGLEVKMHRLGDQVLELASVSFAYPGSSPTIDDVSLLLGPGDRLGIVGENGRGKSTLLDLIAGRLTPTAGALTLGPTVVVGYYDQHGEELDPSLRVQEVVAGPHGTPGSLDDVALMKRFWFTGNLPFTAVADLSGGERRRLQLLAVLAQQPNVLLLDEPTNDLDLDTLRALEEFLEDWPGTLLVVSHDRAFLDRTAERIFAVREGGSFAEVPGGLEGWLAECNGATPAPAPGLPQASPLGGPQGVPVNRLLRDLDKEIQKLTRQRDKLMTQLEATNDHEQLHQLGAELRQLTSALHGAEESWLELAERAEQEHAR